MVKLTALLIFLISSFAGLAKIDKQVYYDALASEDIAEINTMIGKLEKESQTTTIKAYKGALMAKKANFITKASEKLDVFKAGVDLLEKAIESTPQNVEYRFLRLSIQEHSPKILKYKTEIEKDKQFIIANFSKVDAVMANIIKDYSKKSSVLHLDELN